MAQNISIKNKKAYHLFEISEKWIAGIQLYGTEIKAIREHKANFVDSFCFFNKGELWIKSLHIAEYSMGTCNNHEPARNRKLLLNKKELLKIDKKMKEKGFSIVPLKLFINERGLAKVEIGLGKGKKMFDKRETIKKRDTKIDAGRNLKIKM